MNITAICWTERQMGVEVAPVQGHPAQGQRHQLGAQVRPPMAPADKRHLHPAGVSGVPGARADALTP